MLMIQFQSYRSFYAKRATLPLRFIINKIAFN